jgi:predicted TIM-barrel fold metal-dependent hydrolase
MTERGAATRDGRQRVDVHFHVYPPQVLAQADSRADHVRRAQGFDWDISRSAEVLEADGSSIGILSFVNPTFWAAGIAAQRKLARLCNDYFAQIVRDYPGRFGLFACLPPLGDVDGVQAEIEYAFDSLQADGVRVMTSYGAEAWLGHASFDPIWDELDRRRAVVFVHPDMACTCAAPPSPSIELPFDTARTCASLWQAGAFVRWPNIRFVFSHGGGPLPMLLSRLNGLGRLGPGGAVLRDADVHFRGAYYDTAQAVGPAALAAVLSFADPRRILFGSDRPFAPARPQADMLAETLDPALLHAVEWDNALALLPRLARASQPSERN